MFDYGTRALLVALVLLTLGKAAFYLAEWGIRRSAEIAVQGRNPGHQPGPRSTNNTRLAGEKTDKQTVRAKSPSS
jgi:hypothetical protein